MKAARNPPQVVVVVVPAHDEADRIESCIQSIALAAATPTLAGTTVELTVVLDACHDTTGERAETAIVNAQRACRTFTGRVSEVAHTNVGRARAHGMNVAMSELAGIDPGQVWLSTTDADSVVPGHWLAHHLHVRATGYDAIAGTIRVRSWDGQPAAIEGLHARHYRAEGGERFGHRHVHGANLGFSAHAYLRAGGFTAIATGEDHALWRDLRAAGVAAISTPLAAVTTSSRREGRAPHGFANFLRTLGDAEP